MVKALGLSSGCASVKSELTFKTILSPRTARQRVPVHDGDSTLIGGRPVAHDVQNEQYALPTKVVRMTRINFVDAISINFI